MKLIYLSALLITNTIGCMEEEPGCVVAMPADSHVLLIPILCDYLILINDSDSIIRTIQSDDDLGHRVNRHRLRREQCQPFRIKKGCILVIQVRDKQYSLAPKVSGTIPETSKRVFISELDEMRQEYLAQLTESLQEIGSTPDLSSDGDATEEDST